MLDIRMLAHLKAKLAYIFIGGLARLATAKITRLLQIRFVNLERNEGERRKTCRAKSRYIRSLNKSSTAPSSTTMNISAIIIKINLKFGLLSTMNANFLYPKCFLFRPVGNQKSVFFTLSCRLLLHPSDL